MLVSATFSRAANATWLGTQNNQWANNANWSAAPYPENTETATFNSDGNSQTVISLPTGFFAVGYIIFTGPSVAAYTIGTGTRDSQTLIISTPGEYRIDASAASSQTFNCGIQLGGGTIGGAYTFRNDAPERLLTLSSVFVPTTSSSGTKTVYLRGAGPITILGNIQRGVSGLNLNIDNGNTMTLSGESNTLYAVYLNGTNGILKLDAGARIYFNNGGSDNIIASQSTTIDGPGSIVLSTNTGDDHGNNAVATGHTLTINAKLTGDSGFQYYHASNDYAGTVVMNNMNDYSRSTVLYAAGTLSCSYFGMSGTAGNIGTNARVVLDHAGARLLYTGTGETTDRTLEIKSGGTLEHAGSGPLVFTAPTTSSTTGTKKLTLRNFAAAEGECRGAIVNGSGIVSLAKEGNGTWSLTAANTFSGTLAVHEGTLILSGAAGAAASAASYSVSNGATLRLDNTAVANHANRLNDAGSVTLLGGTLRFANDAGAANFSESAGALVAGYGACTVQTDQSADGRTSALRFASLSRLNGATLAFVGAGLGMSDRNRVFITGQPEGPLGNWITLNGQPAYYSAANGVTEMPAWSVTEIAARGPSSVVPNNAAAAVHITQSGTDGPITLAGDPTTSVALLRQCTDTAAEVDTANKTLRAYRIGIDTGQAALTLGTAVGAGALAPLSPGGTLELLNDASGSALTVNAAITNNTAASTIAKYGVGQAIIAGPTLYTGATEIHEGTLTFAGHVATQRLDGAVSGSGTLVKTGTNVLDLAAANSNFTGPILVQQGTLLVRQSQALGTSDAGTVIADDATLDVGGSGTMDTINLGAETVTVQGAGADGRGVIVNRSSVQQVNALGNIELAGDATFGGLSRWDIRNGSFNMNNHSVTKKGGAAFGLSGTETVTPGGDNASFDIQEGSLRLQQSLQMGGSAANTVRLRSGTMLDFYDLSAQPAWRLICEDNTAFNASHSAGEAQNRWGGPVTLNGLVRLTFDSSGNYVSGFAGEVTGLGSLFFTNGFASVQPRFYLTGTNNTYRGSTQVAGGWITVASIKNIGEPCSLGQPMTVADATIRLGSGDLPGRLTYAGSGNTTDRTIELSGTSVNGWSTISHDGSGPLVISNMTFAAGTKRLYIIGNSTKPATIISPITDSSTGSTELKKQGDGTWVLAGANTYSGSTMFESPGLGTLVFTGSNNLAGAFYIGTGMLRMPAGSFMSSTNNFGIRDNGAFHLDGGTFIRDTPIADGETFSIGSNPGGYGHLSVNSGKLVSTRLYAGRSGIGTTRFTGGEAIFNHYVHVGRERFGTLTILPGGNVSQPVTTSDKDCYISYNGGRGEVNLLGGTYLQAKGRFQAGNSSGGTSVVNLCQGTLTTRYFSYGSGVLLINFAGGSLQHPDTAVISNPLIPNHASVQVFSYGPRDGCAGGAVIDTNGRDISLPASIRAPAGQGVYAIAIQEQGSRYLGEPYVQISGDGFGACAVANMEDDGQGRGTYRVASVTVTCPGVNYTTPPTVTFLGGGCLTTARVSTVTLAPNTSGGFTKIGTGTLTLSGANTYTGATTVAAGTLKLGVAQALPTGTSVILAGGTLDLNGFTLTNAISGSGTLANGTLQALLSPAGAGTVGTSALTLAAASVRGTYLADFTAAGACDRIDVTGSINLSDLVLQIVDPAGLNRRHAYTILTCTGTRNGTFSSTNLPQGWHVSYSVPNTVKLFFTQGTMIRVR